MCRHLRGITVHRGDHLGGLRRTAGHHAASETYAERAKADLDRFQDGLRVTHEGTPSHNTLIGHSYGSTVIGHTARDEGIDADELVFVGSPGVGVDHASQLNFPINHVFATVAEHDIIHLANLEVRDEYGNPHDVVHGFDPTGPDLAPRYSPRTRDSRRVVYRRPQRGRPQ